MPVRAVLFDLGDTLVRLGAFPDMAPLLAPRLAGAIAGDPGATAVAIAARCAAAARTASETAAHAELRLAGIVRECLRAAGSPGDETLCAALADVYGEADISRIFAVEGRGALLSSLRDRGLRLGIVSNTTTRGELLDGMLERFGLLGFFDAVVYSSERGVRKPHAEIYHSALEELGAVPDEVVFVGDRLREDVLGPQAAGMKGVLTHEFYKSPHNGEPFAVIGRLEEIAAVLDAADR